MQLPVDLCFLDWGMLVLIHRFAATAWKTIIHGFTELMAAVREILKHFSCMPCEIKLFNF